MQRIPLWGKIVGGCSILLFLGLIVLGGCTALIVATSEPAPPTETSQTASSPEETTEPEETETTTEPEVDVTNDINTCVPDQDQILADTVASLTSSEVTIFSDQVYLVVEDSDLNTFYVVTGSDVGTIILYTTHNVNGDPMTFAANDVAYEYTFLDYPENMGVPAIDTDSETYKVAEGCVS